MGRFDPGRGDASAALSPDGARLFVGTGSEVVVIRTDTLATTARWRTLAPISGLGVSSDGDRLWVGQPDRAVALDPRLGLVVAAVRVPGLIGIADVRVAP